MGIDTSPSFFRASASYGDPHVSRDSGIYEAGVISDVSIITRGEALGHDLWIDQDFLADVTQSINTATLSSSTGGVKARFTHPGLSSDGVGQKLGRIRNARTEGDQVFADLHFQQAAHKTPDGDLADYVMTLAEETPDDFGLSIVFEHDPIEEEDHVIENTSGNRYVSPDEDNKNNFKHARLSELRAADVVDSPAANPEGMFQRGQEAAKQGEKLMEYALGLSDARPGVSCFGVDPDRLSVFVQRFLKRHQLSITKDGDPVADVSKDEAVVETPPTREDFTAELDRFVDKFGAEDGTKWFTDQIEYETAMELHLMKIQDEVKLLNAKIGELEEVISSINQGEDSDVDFADGDNAPEKEKSLNNRIRIQGRSYN